LIDSFEANFKFFQDLMIHAGYKPPSRETYEGMFHMTMEGNIKALLNTNDGDEIKRVWLIGKNREIPYHDELIISPNKYKTVIQALSKKYTLAIVTSRVKGYVFSMRQLSDLENLFKTVVYFEDTTKHKPDPDPLLLACERLAIKPKEAVYIGDTNTDIQAAKAAGMKVIIYSKNALLEADAVTDSFEQIPKLVETMSKE